MLRTSIVLVLAALALAAPTTSLAGNGHGNGPKDDVRELSPSERGKKAPLVDVFAPASAAAASAQAAVASVPGPPVGTVKRWVTRDQRPAGTGLGAGGLYFGTYRLEAIGRHVEVWVAVGPQSFAGVVSNGLEYPAGDCRNDARTRVTPEQISYLIEQFDTVIYPREAEVFSVPQSRDGSRATAPGPPPGYYAGPGERLVLLVSNIRDENFFDRNNAAGHSYVGGFHSPQINLLVDRNVLTIDGFDWLHRTGANPPNEPVPGDPCASSPARPFLYEGTLAHEYQHLLVQDAGPGEATWANEGLSAFAQTLTGYSKPSTPIGEIGFDSQVQCFLGWLAVQSPANPNPRATSGPENSLTLWGDQGGAELLCDYGAAYTFMEYLAGRFGLPFMTALHREDAGGFVGLQNVLDQFVTGERVDELVTRWAATVALDGALDRDLRGAARGSDFSAPSLDALVNWDGEHAYASPGAPPNGSDYVRLRDAAGRYVGAGALRSLEFRGAIALPPIPLEWTVVASPAGQPGDPAFFAGRDNNSDRALVRSVSVPAANPTLTFDTRWDTETGWDFGFVQISVDGGRTWRSLANADTTAAPDPNAIQRVKSNVPGFTGHSGGWRTESFDLSAYAGRTVLLAFRYVSDSNTNDLGWYVDDIAVGGIALGDGSSLADWRSATQVFPTPVQWSVQLVGYASDGGTPPVLGRVPVGADGSVALDGGKLRRLIGNQADVVGAVVTFVEPSESASAYARYELKANGVTQPGG